MNKNPWQLYKVIYKDIKLSDAKVGENWQMLQKRLPVQDKKVIFTITPQSYRFLLAGLLVLLFCAVTIKESEPGDILYPVKVLSESIATKVTNTYDAYVEKHPDTPLKSTDKNEKEITADEKEGASKDADTENDNSTPVKKPTITLTENLKQATGENKTQKKSDQEKSVNPTEQVKSNSDVRGESAKHEDKKREEKEKGKSPEKPPANKR